MFDPTISAGNLITIGFGVVVWGITLTVAWTKFGGRMDMMDFRIGLMEKALEDIAEVLKKFNTSETDIIVLKKELAALQLEYSTLNQTVEDLRRGNGWISSNRRNSVDGEYPKAI